MVVQHVLPDAGNLVGIEIIDARVNIKRDDGQFVVDEDGFRLLEEFLALLDVGLLVGRVD